MYTYSKELLPQKTIALHVTIPVADVQAQEEKSFEELRKTLEVQGFRKGKAPADVARKHLRKEAIYDHLLRALIPSIYSEIVTKEGMKPVISPYLDVKEVKEGTDWQLTLKTAEAPEITLGDYKEKVKEAKKSMKTDAIWTPGKDTEISPEEKERQNRAAFQAALEALVKTVTIEISDLIVEQDIERKLSRLLDDIQRVGLSVESYLQSKDLTKDKLREQLKAEVLDTYKLEFALQKIADEENIMVDEKETEKLFSAIKTEKEREEAKKNMYYYVSVMRKQKVLDYLNSL